MKYVLIPIADGTEEIEAVCMIDTLRRAEINVTVASVGNQLDITASRGVKLVADTSIHTCTTKLYDMIALPGGIPGATHLSECDPLIVMLREQQRNDRLIAAICAAPAVVLHAHGLLKNTRATCYPAMQDQLDPEFCVNNGIVVEKNTITGQGPGYALKFSLELVEQLVGHEKRRAVAQSMLIDE